MQQFRASGSKAILPFLTAGYPDLATTEAMLTELSHRGVKVCELGVPFSDPVADGPVIQSSYTDALAKGVTSQKIFQAVRNFRQNNRQAGLAIIAMVSYSIVYRNGVESYFEQAAHAGIDGMIIPDLPLEEAGDVEALAASQGLALVMLVAPTTPPARRLEIAAHSRGFIYYVSVSGITGQREGLPQSTIDGVAELRRHVQTPICVGFGISNQQTVSAVWQAADGAIVGSAIVKRITDAIAKGQSRQQIVGGVGDFVAELMAAPIPPK